MIQRARRFLSKINVVDVSEHLFELGIQGAAVAGVVGFLFVQVKGSWVYLVPAAAFGLFCILASLIVGTVDRQSSKRDFPRDVPVAGILPNLMVSAARGEWDRWDTFLLACFLALVVAVFHGEAVRRSVIEAVTAIF